MFHKCKDRDEIKALYRKLSLRLHPDHGGESIHMILLTECYNIALECMKDPIKIKNSSKKYEKVTEDIYADDKERMKIIEEIKNYAKKHPRFSPLFVESIDDFLTENGYITSTQFNSLVKIYYSFRMDEKA